MKSVLVTGAAKRLGRAIVLDLAGAGWNVALHYHGSAQDAEKTAAEARGLGVKVATFKALSTNARNFGNKLNDDQVGVVQKTVATAPNLDVKTAASEARGALDLPADQAKQLIIGQSKVTN